MKIDSKLTLVLFPVLFFILLSLGSAVSQPAQAAGLWYVAPSGSDSNDCLTTTTPCATLNGAIGKAGAGDTLYVATGIYTSTTGGQVVFLNKNLTLSGGWQADFTTQTDYSTIDGEDVRRGITVNGGVTATLEFFRVQHGLSGGVPGGGGIQNNGALTLNHVVVTQNRAYTPGASGGGGGAGIANFGPLILNQSVITGNASIGFNGGGIWNNYYANLTLNRSTVSQNSGNGGGGIALQTGTVVLNNSTVSMNTGYLGGGIQTNGVMTITNSTISGNTATQGGGIYSEYNFNTSFKNSLLANNTSTQFGPDCYGALLSAGYNLVENLSDCSFTATAGDLTGVDPQLGPLRDNGGSTLTQALLANSPAVDAGQPTGCTDSAGNLLTTDQRGLARPSGSTCDIGAYEAVFANLVVSAQASPNPVSIGQTLTYLAVITNTGPAAAMAVVLTDTLPTGVTF